jgi:hypothetical protein
MNGSIGKEYTALCIDVPADVEDEIDAWLESGVGREDAITDWGDFIAAAWAVLPDVWNAYQIYKSGYASGDLIAKGPAMTLAEFAQYSVYEWFK